MKEIGSNYKLEKSNDLITKNLNETLDNQKHKWAEIQSLISKNVKEIFWKAWIKPLKYVKFEKLS